MPGRLGKCAGCIDLHVATCSIQLHHDTRREIQITCPYDVSVLQCDSLC